MYMLSAHTIASAGVESAEKWPRFIGQHVMLFKSDLFLERHFALLCVYSQLCSAASSKGWRRSLSMAASHMSTGDVTTPPSRTFMPAVVP